MIAIVDDDATVRGALTRLLRAHGLAAIDFPSAEAFLSRETTVQLDYLIVDIYLKHMSGIDLRDVLESAGADVPIVFVTAVTDSTTLEAARKGGAYSCLSKPIDEMNLMSALAAARRLPARK